MKILPDCIPCVVRQALESVRLVAPERVFHEQVLREVLRAAAELNLHQTPPEMAQWLHRRIRGFVGQNDPYRQIKDRYNRLALALYPTLREWVEKSDNPLETAVRLAIVGNVIGSGVSSQLSKVQVRESIIRSLSTPLDGNVEEFSLAVLAAQRILYLVDNAGEIVFDCLLIERMLPGRVTVGVKGSSMINDATLKDAEDTGITSLVEVIDNGSDAPGTILSDCSEAFVERFNKADLIVAKGQGNYETLSEVNKNIYFLLKAKCPLIARNIGCQMDSLVMRRSALCEAL